jgi:Tfp pilus assembly protein PilX
MNRANKSGQALLTSRNKAGQALLIILLAMVTITTVVLSIVSRSVSEIEITNKEEDSLRAFTAAEAGIEEALVTASLGTQLTESITVPTTGSNTAEISNYTVNVTGYPQTATQFAYPFELSSGDSGAVWLVSRDGVVSQPCTSSTPCFNPASQNLTVCWGNTTPTQITSQSPAIELTFIYKVSNVYYTTRAVFDPFATRRNSENKFQVPTSTNGSGCNNVAGESYKFRKDFTTAELTTGVASSLGLPSIAGATELLKVRLLYNTTPQAFGIISNSNLPPQGRQVSSVGESGNSTRKIEAFLLNPSTPSVFDSALYSNTRVVKN